MQAVTPRNESGRKIPNGAGILVRLKWIEYGVYRDLITIYPKPYSVYLRGTIGFSPCVQVLHAMSLEPLALLDPSELG